MVSYLKKYRFKVQRLTNENITPKADRVVSPIRNQVLLLLMKLIKKEASWAVTYAGDLYHNFEISLVGQLEFLNHPVLEQYLVWHPTWGHKKSEQFFF